MCWLSHGGMRCNAMDGNMWLQLPNFAQHAEQGWRWYQTLADELHDTYQEVPTYLYADHLVGTLIPDFGMPFAFPPGPTPRWADPMHSLPLTDYDGRMTVHGSHKAQQIVTCTSSYSLIACLLSGTIIRISGEPIRSSLELSTGPQSNHHDVV